jgi:hypothetical protein
MAYPDKECHETDELTDFGGTAANRAAPNITT